MLEINKNLFINQEFKDKSDCIDYIGDILLKNRFIEKEYIESMHQRDENTSVYVGNYLAICHGEYGSEKFIKSDGLCLIHCKKPIDWDGNIVHFVIGLAVKNDSHMDILSNIAVNFMDEDKIKDLISNPNYEELSKLVESS